MRRRIAIAVLASSLAFMCGCSRTISIPVHEISYVCGCQPNRSNPGGSGYVVYQGNYCGFQEMFFIETGLNEISKIPDMKKVELQLYCQKVVGPKTMTLSYEPIIEPWDNQVTYDHRPESDASLSIETSMPDGNSWHIIDITRWIETMAKEKKIYFGIVGYTKPVKSIETSTVVFSSMKNEETKPRIIVYLK